MLLCIFTWCWLHFLDLGGGNGYNQYKFRKFNQVRKEKLQAVAEEEQIARPGKKPGLCVEASKNLGQSELNLNPG